MKIGIDLCLGSEVDTGTFLHLLCKSIFVPCFHLCQPGKYAQGMLYDACFYVTNLENTPRQCLAKEACVFLHNLVFYNANNTLFTFFPHGNTDMIYLIVEFDFRGVHNHF